NFLGQKFEQQIRHLALKPLMAAVAHRLFAGTFAGTEPGFLRLCRFVFDRREGCALVRAVAKRLRLRAPAGTPPIARAGFQFDRDRPPTADLGHCSRFAQSLVPPPSVASHASPQALASSRTRRM